MKNLNYTNEEFLQTNTRIKQAQQRLGTSLAV